FCVVDWGVVYRKNKRRSNLVVHNKENRSQQEREITIMLAPQTNYEGVEAIKLEVTQGGSTSFLYVTKKMVSLNSTSFTLNVEDNIEDFDFVTPWWITAVDSVAINNFIKRYTFNVDASYFEHRTDNVIITGN